MISSSPVTYRDVLKRHELHYDIGIRDGEFLPLVYPWASIPCLLVMVYLLVPHKNSPFLSMLKWPVWYLLFFTSLFCTMYCKGRSMALTYAVGLVSAWITLWSATIMLVYDCQIDFRRINRITGPMGVSRKAIPSRQSSNEGVQNGVRLKNGHEKQNLIGQARSRKEESTQPVDTSDQFILQTGQVVWQAYPMSSFLERLDWVLDVFCNSRGIGWNWQIPGPPPLPPSIQKQLQEDNETKDFRKDTSINRFGMKRYNNRKDLLLTKLRVLLVGYLMFDILKIVMMRDPYFWGFVEAEPSDSIPNIIRSSAIITRSFRLILSATAIITAMSTLFAISSLLFAGLMGPAILGIRGEPWMYADTYGSFRRNVLDHGLAGWWGGWWHQTFRFAFEAPSARITEGLKIDPKSLLGKTIQLFIAFSLSGVLHTCGSHSQMGSTYPFTGPFLFFLTQPFGIMFEALMIDIFRKVGATKRTPKLARQMVHLVYVAVWFYYTAPLLCDDFARGGLWLVEPVPASPLRAMGLGIPGDSWWCWGASWRDWIHWHQGEHWWQTGYAI